MVKHPWPLLEISLSDFRRLATLNIYTYLPKLRRGLTVKKLARKAGDPWFDFPTVASVHFLDIS